MLWLPRRESKTSPPNYPQVKISLVTGFLRGKTSPLLWSPFPKSICHMPFLRLSKLPKCWRRLMKGGVWKGDLVDFGGLKTENPSKFQGSWLPVKGPRVIWLFLVYLFKSFHSHGFSDVFFGGMEKYTQFRRGKSSNALQETTILLVRSGGKYQLTLDV